MPGPVNSTRPGPGEAEPSPCIVLTGGHGFLGWHTACRLRAGGAARVVRLGRGDLADADRLAAAVSGADAVIHLAGVNRAPTEDQVEAGNVLAADLVAGALRRVGVPRHVVFAGTVHAGADTAYGRGKSRAAEVLRAAVAETGGTLAEVVLPNVFGEHGRPHYNSFVATFCHELAAGRRPDVLTDRDVPLLHAQQAAATLIAAAAERRDHTVRPAGETHAVSEVLTILAEVHQRYAEHAEIPALTSTFRRDLFNTYRSHLDPGRPPARSVVHEDPRGRLVEGVRSHGGSGQVFWSTTVPEAVRGDHYHLHKVERFLVLRGRAEIALRRLLHDDVVRIRVDGDSPAPVDMPTLWVHSLRNIGHGELVTLFWTDRLLDPADPDQFPERVEMSPGARP